jgi:hypothetical protein
MLKKKPVKFNPFLKQVYTWSNTLYRFVFIVVIDLIYLLVAINVKKKYKYNNLILKTKKQDYIFLFIHHHFNKFIFYCNLEAVLYFFLCLMEKLF